MNQLPGNVLACGIVLDAQHAHTTSILRRSIRNGHARAVLKYWRSNTKKGRSFPFCIVAGPLHRREGVIGGCARDWPGAMELIRYATQRLDSIAATQGDFTSCWLLLVDDARRSEILAMVADGQAVAGHA